MDLFPTQTHHSELQFTALLLMSTIYKSPQHPLSFFLASCIFISRSRVIALRVEMLLLYVLRFELRSLPCRTLLSTINWTTVSSLLPLPSRGQINSLLRTALLIGPPQEPNSEHPVSKSKSLFVCVFFSVGTRLPNRCSETVVIYSLISQPIQSNGCCLVVCFKAPLVLSEQGSSRWWVVSVVERCWSQMSTWCAVTFPIIYIIC
jgi:hypothetical protein